MILSTNLLNEIDYDHASNESFPLDGIDLTHALVGTSDDDLHALFCLFCYHSFRYYSHVHASNLLFSFPLLFSTSLSVLPHHPVLLLLPFYPHSHLPSSACHSSPSLSFLYYSKKPILSSVLHPPFSSFPRFPFLSASPIPFVAASAALFFPQHASASPLTTVHSTWLLLESLLSSLLPPSLPIPCNWQYVFVLSRGGTFSENAQNCTVFCDSSNRSSLQL